mgnify:CR=1 FL=1
MALLCAGEGDSVDHVENEPECDSCNQSANCVGDGDLSETRFDFPNT